MQQDKARLRKELQKATDETTGHAATQSIVPQIRIDNGRQNQSDMKC